MKMSFDISVLCYFDVIINNFGTINNFANIGSLIILRSNAAVNFDGNLRKIHSRGCFGF